MNDDDPCDVVHERFAELVLREHELGRPIGGTPHTIKAVTRDDIVDHYRRHYHPTHARGHRGRRGRPRPALRAGGDRAGPFAMGGCSTPAAPTGRREPG